MLINKDIIADSIQYFGKEMQSIVCMEELCELSQAISKELRGKSDKNHLTEEMADVMICLEILKQIYNVSDDEISTWIDFKQNRIVDRMCS